MSERINWFKREHKTDETFSIRLLLHLRTSIIITPFDS